MTHEEFADAVMGSEDMLWLMCGGSENWRESHISELRKMWNHWIELGGKSWGKRGTHG